MDRMRCSPHHCRLRVQQDPRGKGFKVLAHTVPIPGSPLERVAGPRQDISLDNSSERHLSSPLSKWKAKSVTKPGAGAAVKCQSCS